MLNLVTIEVVPSKVEALSKLFKVVNVESKSDKESIEVNGSDFIDQVAHIVCHVFKKDLNDLKSTSRLRGLVDARKCFVYVLVNNTGFSRDFIGGFINKSSYNTYNLYRGAENLIELDKSFEKNYKKVMNMLKSLN